MNSERDEKTIRILEDLIRLNKGIVRKKKAATKSRLYSLISITLPDKVSNPENFNYEQIRKDSILLLFPNDVSVYRDSWDSSETFLFCTKKWRAPYKAMMFNGDNLALSFNNPLETLQLKDKKFKPNYWPIQDFKSRCASLQQLGAGDEESTIKSQDIKIPTAISFPLKKLMNKGGYKKKFKFFNEPQCLVLCTRSSLCFPFETLRELSYQELMPQEIKIYLHTDNSLRSGQCISLTDRSARTHTVLKAHSDVHYADVKCPIMNNFRRTQLERSLLIFSGIEKQEHTNFAIKHLLENSARIPGGPKMDTYSLSYFNLPKYGGRDNDYDILLVIKPAIIDMRQLLDSLTYDEYTLLPDFKFCLREV